MCDVNMHKGYYWARKKKKLDFQLVLWTSNYHNFLAWGHFLLVLVGDLVRRFMESKVWRPLSWQKNKKNTQILSPPSNVQLVSNL